MIFTALDLKGAFLIEQERKEDARGYFARVFCEDEYKAQGLCTRFVQHNHSFNAKKHTLRGMHWQAEPHGEIKVVSCLKGAITDVLVDVRQGSVTFGHWRAFELTPQNARALYIPRGFAHGFITHVDDTLVHYLMSDAYQSQGARGFRYDDAAVNIDWPFAPSIISERDDKMPPLHVALSEQSP